MPRYVAAYDTESPDCLDACRKIVEVHRRHDMPATFFITGQALTADADEYRRLLDDPLFEVATHTWSHGMLLDHPFCGPALPAPEVAEQITRGKAAAEDVFGQGQASNASYEHDRNVDGALGLGAILTEVGTLVIFRSAYSGGPGPDSNADLHS